MVIGAILFRQYWYVSTFPSSVYGRFSVLLVAITYRREIYVCDMKSNAKSPFKMQNILQYHTKIYITFKKWSIHLYVHNLNETISNMDVKKL